MGRPGSRLGKGLVDRGQRGVNDFGVELDRSATFSPSHTAVLTGTQELAAIRPRRRQSRRRSRRAAVPTATRAAGRARSTRASHVGPSYHQWPNNSVSNAATTWRPPDALGLRDQPAAYQVDEVGDMDVDGTVGALGVIRRLGVGRHVAAVTLAGLRRLSGRRWEIAVGGVPG